MAVELPGLIDLSLDRLNRVTVIAVVRPQVDRQQPNLERMAAYCFQVASSQPFQKRLGLLSQEFDPGWRCLTPAFSGAACDTPMLM